MLWFCMYSLGMKIRAGSANGLSKQDAKCLALIDDYFYKIKEIRKKMQRSKAEIERLKASSHRKLAQINNLLAPV